MPSLILPSRFTQQPQQATPIDRGNPITRGLQFWQTGRDDGPFVNTNGVTTAATSRGVAKRYAAASSQYLVAVDDKVKSLPLTFFALAQFDTVSGNQALVSIGAGTNDRHGLYIATGRVAIFSGAGATTAQAIAPTSPLITANQMYALGGRITSDASRDVWINGKLVASSIASASPQPTNRIALGAFWASGVPTASQYHNGPLALALAWNRALSDSEMQSIADNPYQVYKAQPRRLWVVSVAGGSLLVGGSSTRTASNAALTTRVAMSSTGSTPARSAVSIRTQVQLAATGVTRASAAASLIPGALSLAVDTVTRGAAVALLATQVLMGSTGLTRCDSVATLSTDATPLAVAANTRASATASLSTRVVMAAAGNTRASASAALISQGVMSSGAETRGSSVATLQTQVALSTVSTSRSVASAALATKINLGASSITRSRSLVDLTVPGDVTVAPSVVTVGGGVVVDFTWSVGGDVTLVASAGTIAPDGTFLSPAASDVEQTVTLTVTSVLDPSKSGTATIIIPAVEAPKPMATRTVSISLGSPAGAASNLTGLSVSFHDEPAPHMTTVPRYQSSSETTDATGKLTFSFSSTLAVGGMGLLTVEGAAGIHFNAPIAVA